MIDNLNILIWEREFDIKVDYDIFEDEEVLPEQLETLNVFMEHPEWIEKAKVYVEDYCKKAVMNDESNDKKDNIFSYVKPDYLFVKYETKKHRIALMCNYKYDAEHGIAIVFDNQGNITVGMQDIIL